MIERETPAAVPPDSARRQPDNKPVRGRRTVKSSELFGGGGHELLIDHHGEIYSLRETSKGKLILTK